MDIENVYYSGQVIWSQIDANRHVRHSAYADFCAQARSNLFHSIGLSLDTFSEHNIGPILFKETISYFKEIKMDENIRVTVEMTKYNRKNSRFSFHHVVYKENGIKCATVDVDGAWLDLDKRKLTQIPEMWLDFIKKIPKSKDFVEVV